MLTHPECMTRPLQLEGTWAPGHLLEHLELAAPQAGEGSTARTSSTAPLNLGGFCRRKRTAPSPAPHCAVPRSRAASHAARKHAPHPPHPPATLRRAPWGVTPRCRAWVPVEIAVERSFLRGGRRVSFAGRRSPVVGRRSSARRRGVPLLRALASRRADAASAPVRRATRHDSTARCMARWTCVG